MPGAETNRRVPAAPVRPVVLGSPGSRPPSANQVLSDGWLTSTGAMVVGRSTPGGVTGARTTLLIKVDLPAPVGPPTTTSSGASGRASRGSR